MLSLDNFLEKEYTGRAEVKEIYDNQNGNCIAECLVIDGFISLTPNTYSFKSGKLFHRGFYLNGSGFITKFNEGVKFTSPVRNADNNNNLQKGDVLECYEVLGNKKTTKRYDGTAEVKSISDTSNGMKIDCLLEDGAVLGGSVMYLYRDGECIHEGWLDYGGHEGYVGENYSFEIEKFNDIKPGDVLEFYKLLEFYNPKRKIVSVIGQSNQGRKSLLNQFFKIKNSTEVATFLFDAPLNSADIVILVVAADDPYMAEIVEQIKNDDPRFVVAINKMDKPGANADRVMQQLNELNIQVEEWGGDIPCQLISAKTGDGIEDLLGLIATELTDHTKKEKEMTIDYSNTTHRLSFSDRIPLNRTLISPEVSGYTKYYDLIEGVSFKEELNKETGLDDWVVIESSNPDIQPRIGIVDLQGQLTAVYHLPVGSRILVKHGDFVNARFDAIANSPRQNEDNNLTDRQVFNRITLDEEQNIFTPKEEKVLKAHFGFTKQNINDLAKELGITEEEVCNIKDESLKELDKYISFNLETKIFSNILLNKKQTVLTPREIKILQWRFAIDNKSIEEVIQELEITKERVRSIETKALKKLLHPSTIKKYDGEQFFGKILMDDVIHPYTGELICKAGEEIDEINSNKITNAGIQWVRVYREGVEELYLGRAEVGTFASNSTIQYECGLPCCVVDGVITQNANVRVLRGGNQIHDGVVSQLRRFNEPAEEIKAGFQCAIEINNFNNLQTGDILEAYEIVDSDNQSVSSVVPVPDLSGGNSFYFHFKVLFHVGSCHVEIERANATGYVFNKHEDAVKFFKTNGISGKELQERLLLRCKQKMELNPSLKNNDVKTTLDNHESWLKSKKAQLNGLNLKGITISDKDLRFIEFRYAHLNGCSFSRCNMEDAKLEFSNLDEAKFIETRLKGADLSNASLKNSIFTNTKINFSLDNANLEEACFKNVVARDFCFNSKNMQWISFVNSDLRGINLANADLSNAHFVNCDMSNAVLSNVNLSNAEFGNCDLSGANLTHSQLLNTNFGNSNLTRANFTGVDCKNTNFENAKLANANLRNAKLSNPLLPDFQLPSNEEIIGWKKLKAGVLAKLRIPKEAKRTACLVSNRCRTNRAEVLWLSKNKEKAVSQYDKDFVYEVGKFVEVKEFNDDIKTDLGEGIHFFKTKIEAMRW